MPTCETILGTRVQEMMEEKKALFIDAQWVGMSLCS